MGYLQKGKTRKGVILSSGNWSLSEESNPGPADYKFLDFYNLLSSEVFY